MHNVCIGELRNTPILPIMVMNDVFETTPFWALGVYGHKHSRLQYLSIRPYTAEYTAVYFEKRPYIGSIFLHHVVVSAWKVPFLSLFAWGVWGCRGETAGREVVIPMPSREDLGTAHLDPLVARVTLAAKQPEPAWQQKLATPPPPRRAAEASSSRVGAGRRDIGGASRPPHPLPLPLPDQGGF